MNVSYPPAWGRLYWDALHRWARAAEASFSGEAGAEAWGAAGFCGTDRSAREWAETLVRDTCMIVPCPTCGVHCLEHQQAHPPVFERPADMWAYLVRFHNAVNRRTGKRELTDEEARLSLASRPVFMVLEYHWVWLMIALCTHALRQGLSAERPAADPATHRENLDRGDAALREYVTAYLVSSPLNAMPGGPDGGPLAAIMPAEVERCMGNGWWRSASDPLSTAAVLARASAVVAHLHDCALAAAAPPSEVLPAARLSPQEWSVLTYEVCGDVAIFDAYWANESRKQDHARMALLSDMLIRRSANMPLPEGDRGAAGLRSAAEAARAAAAELLKAERAAEPEGGDRVSPHYRTATIVLGTAAAGLAVALAVTLSRKSTGTGAAAAAAAGTVATTGAGSPGTAPAPPRAE